MERQIISENSSNPPLIGLKVFDMTQVIAGPFCTTMLADLGAEIVKLERPPSGDDTRTVGRYKGRENHEDYFFANNRSKKSIVLNLKKETDRLAAIALANKADVCVENLAIGTAEKFGLGWNNLQKENPKLVYCSISGFGQTGPYKNRVALDPILQSISGMMSITGQPEGEPMQVGAPIADSIAGMFAAYSILGALHAAEKEGKGRYIDISMQDSTLAVLGPRMGEILQAGISPARYGNENPMRVPANTYKTKDGKNITVIVQNDRYWKPFCIALKKEDWIDDSRFSTMEGRRKHRDKIDQVTTQYFSSNTSDYWANRLEKERVPFAFVNDYKAAVEDPQVKHRGLIQTISHPISGEIRVVGPPWKMSGSQAKITRPPLLGEHTLEVLKEWLNWNDDQIQEFQKKRA
ncbi:MAG: CoA transferase [Nitrospinota bacterium]|nr:CoA transferase [Nitrospinota bacterium]